MDEKRVTFRSGDLALEGLLAVPSASAAAGAAVVCHPHPLYGGSMHNNVVEAILEAMWSLGCATLRFNFRGVGASEGGYDEGKGESRDALAAVAFAVANSGVRAGAVTLAGYSFGAMVATRAGLATQEVNRVIAVALPVAMADLSSLGAASKPVLLVSGDRDSYSSPGGVRALGTALGPLATVRIIPGADHFFGGFEGELSSVIAGALDARV